MKPIDIFGKNPSFPIRAEYSKIAEKDCIVFHAHIKRKGNFCICKDERGYSLMMKLAGKFSWSYTEDIVGLNETCRKEKYGPYDVEFFEDEKLMREFKEQVILQSI